MIGRLTRWAKKGYRAGKRVKRFGEQVLAAELELNQASELLHDARRTMRQNDPLTAEERQTVLYAMDEAQEVLVTLQRGAQAARRRVGA